MVRDKMKDMVTRGTGWDPSPKQGMFGWPPVRSYTCWLRMPWEKHFTPQQVLHHRLKMGRQKEDDPLHSTPLLRWQLWPQTVAVMSFVMLGRACGVTLLGLILFSWGRHWRRHNSTALPEGDSWQRWSSCKAPLRLSCFASHGLPIVRSKAEKSPEHHLWQHIYLGGGCILLRGLGAKFCWTKDILIPFLIFFIPLCHLNTIISSFQTSCLQISLVGQRQFWVWSTQWRSLSSASSTIASLPTILSTRNWAEGSRSSSEHVTRQQWQITHGKSPNNHGTLLIYARLCRFRSRKSTEFV